MYLAGVLRRQGWDNVLLDQAARPFDPDDLARWVQESPTDFVGFYTDAELRAKVLAWIRGLAERCPGTPILVGGPGTQEPVPYLDAGARVAALGEAEHTILDLVAHLRGQRALEDIPGIAWRGAQGVRVGPPARRVDDLDDLPFPDWTMLDLRDYHDHQIIGMQLPYLSVMASRGCVFRCSYCASPAVFPGGVRQRSPGNVVREIGQAVERYGVRYVGFHDDLFGWDDDWSEAFCALMEAQPWKVRWACMVHPFTFRRRGIAKLRAWQRAGADVLAIGLQSADPATLSRIHRSRAEPDELARVIAMARQVGIFTKVEFIYGLPGDTAASMDRSSRWAMEASPDAVKFFTLSLLEGSELAGAIRGTRDGCGLTEAQVRQVAARAMRRFYRSPRTLLRLAAYAVRRNPRWFPLVLRRRSFFRSVTGL
jgi:radical SAM superfamily enzyme YgiQ (UPF0313 family)